MLNRIVRFVGKVKTFTRKRPRTSAQFGFIHSDTPVVCLINYATFFTACQYFFNQNLLAFNEIGRVPLCS
jgi:hypothetical protein